MRQQLQWMQELYRGIINQVDRSSIADLKFAWRMGEKVPFADRRWFDAVVDALIECIFKMDLSYNSNTKVCAWSQLPDCVYACSSLNGLPMTVGGSLRVGLPVNNLMSLTEKSSGREWREIFLPMPTKREFISAMCTGTVLIGRCVLQ